MVGSKGIRYILDSVLVVLIFTEYYYLLGFVGHIDYGHNLPDIYFLSLWFELFRCSQVISKLHKACIGYDEWKASNNPTYKPWLHPEQNTLPVLNKADILQINNNNTNEEPSDETDITEDQVNENLERWELSLLWPRGVVFKSNSFRPAFVSSWYQIK